MTNPFCYQAFSLRCIVTYCSLAVTLAAALMQPVMRHSHAAMHTHQPLTFEDRVAAQRAVEEVYWRHRLWPQENGRPKPALAEVMPESVVRAKVEDYLRKSQMLEQYWRRPVTGEQLQAEIERMARHTKQPVVLRELWAALSNDPLLIAECLARPLLVERLGREWYASDERFHGELKRRAESELNVLGAAGQTWRTGGEYREVDWVRDETGVAMRSRGLEMNGELRMSEAQWQEETGRLVTRFGPTKAMAGLPVGQWSRLAEDEERFYAVAVVEKDAERIKVASVVWKKMPLDEWWDGARVGMGLDISAPSSEYQLPEIKAVLSPSDGDSWTATSNAGVPSARSAHAAVWTGSEMIVWGGTDGVTNFNTGGKYNPATDTWSTTGTTAAPEARFVPAGVWTGTEMIVWGGQAGSAVGTGGRYNPTTNTWRPTTSTGAPSPRSFHTAVWTGSEMIVWGGGPTLTTQFNTGGRYNPTTDIWMTTSTVDAPRIRDSHTAVWTGDEMIVWGGFTNAIPISNNTGGRYNPATNTWIATTTAGAPDARFFHTAVWTGSEMIVWGGSDLDTGGRYNPAADMWTTTSATGAPSARRLHSAVWTGSEMIVWGGRAGNVYFNTGGRYDPSANAWAATATASAPVPRSNQTAVWTGSTMIVWGGLASSTRLNTGGRYTFTVTQGSLASVSAASFLGAEMAADSIVAAFGQSLTTATESATTLPLPTTLAGTNVRLRDSAGVERLAPLFFVSLGQINYLIPPGAANGNATVNVTRGGTLVATGAVRLAPVAPGLFAANANGQGVAAAVALRIKTDGSQSFEPVARFNQAQNRFVAAPINLGAETDQVFLILFGTGYRARSSLAAVTCQIGGTAAEVLFAGAAPGLAGVDQSNVRLPRSLAGRGELEIALTVDGKVANRVTVAFSGTPTCAYSISPSERSISANAGTGSVNVTAPNGCAWTAASNASWITITSGSSGSGNGTVNYSVAQNTSAAQRTGTMTIAGQTFTVTQAGSTEPGQTAELKVDDGSAEGGLLTDGRMMVNRLTPPSYPATLRSIRVLFLRFQDQPDPTGQPITLVYFTDPSGSGQPPGGVQFTRINATVPGISSSNFFEFQIPNGPMINSGDFYVGYRAPSPHMGVGFTIDGNSQAQNRSFRSLDDGATFQGPITVQGFNAANALIRAMVSIGGSCNYSISPASQSFNASGGAGSVNVATTTGCAWTAAVNNAPWITITSGSSGAGNGTVNYSVAANTTTSSRTGTITITGQTFTVNQAGGTSGSDVALTSGVPQTGSLPAPSTPNSCAVQLSQQYFIPVSSGATQLRITLSGNQDVDLFARVGQRITLEGGMLLSDYKSDSLSGNEEINVTPSSSPPLRAANYYIVVANCGPGTASFTVTGTVTTGQPSVASVSAANFLGAEMAADSIVAAFGQNPATATESAATIPLPTTLAGTSVRMRDSAGMARRRSMRNRCSD